MATQYTSILKLALPTQGELSGTWGDVVNDNITSMVEEAIAGRSVINSWAANSHTLTTADGLTSESRAAMLEFTDTGTALSGAATVICPTATKIYVCKNGAGQTVTVKTAAGTGVAIPNGETMFVFCDGTNVVQAVTSLTTLKVGTGIQVSTILDEDNMASDSATALATQQSIKAYVDAQITAQDLDFAGDTGTGAVDLDSQTFTVAGTANEIETSASGQTITIGLPTAIVVTTITTTNVQATNIKANDGTAAITIADSTGQVTVTDAVLTTADINGGTADNVTIGGSTAAAGSFTTLGASGTTTLSGALALTGNLDINTNKFNVTAVDGNTLIAGTLGVTGNVDLNGGTIDGTVIGGTTPAAVTTSSLVATTADINGGTIDGTVIGGSTAAAGTFTSLTASGDVNFDSNTLFVDASANAVGIGTVSPAYTLDVSKGSSGVVARFTGGGAASYIYADSTTVYYGAAAGVPNTLAINNASNFINFNTNGTERMRIDSSGNLGLGVAPSAWDVTGSGGPVLQIKRALLFGADTETRLIHNAYYGTGNFRYIATGVAATNYQQNSGQHRWYNAPSGTAGNAISFTQAMTLDASGNLILGGTTAITDTGTPSLTLGNGAGNPSLNFYGTSAGQAGQISFGDATSGTGAYEGYLLYDNANNFMTFGTNHAERVRIDSSGSVGIGTSSPANKLHVAGGKLQITGAAGGGAGGGYLSGETASEFHIVSEDYTGAGYADIVFDSGNGSGSSYLERMRIDGSGRVGIGTSSPASKLNVVSGTNDGITVNDGTVNTILFNTTSANGSVGTTTNHPMAFYTNNTERARIDTSGNLLVGTTSTNFADQGVIITDGQYIGTMGGSHCATYNRLTSDGEMVRFFKDGTAVGSIGVGNASSYTYIGTGDTGLMFNNGNDFIQPWNPSTNANKDNGIDLGRGTSRFKDLYLSGGVQHLIASGVNDGSVVNDGTNDIIAVGTGGFAANGGSASDGGIRATANLVFATGSGAPERMRIDSAGLVGIGTSSPVASLDVVAGADDRTLLGTLFCHQLMPQTPHIMVWH
jgi:hypothetical protein